MSITFSGVGSGLPVNDWIDKLMQVERQPVDALYTKKSTLQTAKTTLSTVESKFSALRSAVEKLTDANLASSFDLFARKTASSSDSTIVTATADNNSSLQNIKVKVDSLATATKAATLNTAQVGKTVDGSEAVTSLDDGQGTTGKFSIFVDGKQQEFEITADSVKFGSNTTAGNSLNSIKQAINDSGIDGLSADITSGKFTISLANGSGTRTISLGASGDTSNFLNVAQLTTAPQNTGGGSLSYSSNNSLTSISTTGAIISNFNQPVTTGTFTIGKASFTIDNNTTLSDLITKINNNTDSGVVAQYDVMSNKLKLTSKNPGQTAITLKDSSNDPTNSTSNFLTAAGLITSAGDSITSQTLGNNAKVYLNDSTTPTYTASNVLTGDITGFAGVTINLNNVSDGKTIDVNVTQDTRQLTDAVSNFVSKFNDIISTIDTNTGTSGALKSDYSLVRLRNDFRQTATTNVNGLTSYDSLGMIGISSGAVGSSAKDTSTALTLDKDKFLNALATNPSEVKALLVGDSKKGVTGILQQLNTKVTNALDPVSGVFASEDNTYQSLISDLDDSIKKGEARLTQTKKRLTDQFTQMDQLISSMQAQSSAISGIR